MQDVYRVRAEGIARETIDGETVVLNLSTGTYFSLAPAASFAWSLLEEGAGDAQIAEALGRRFSGDPNAIDAAVREFLANLEQDGVIEKQSGVSPVDLSAVEGGDEAFPGLAIQRYTDVEELLTVDPVHEVDEAGWPSQPNKN